MALWSCALFIYIYTCKYIYIYIYIYYIFILVPFDGLVIYIYIYIHYILILVPFDGLVELRALALQLQMCSAGGFQVTHALLCGGLGLRQQRLRPQPLYV